MTNEINKITKFQGDYKCLSNFYKCDVVFCDVTWQSAEVAFQAMKCNDENCWESFKNLGSIDAQKLGKTVNLRPDWDEIKLQSMHDIVLSKFSNNNFLKQKLLSTGDDELINGNHWRDKYWGVDETTGQGENHLGKILMQVRNELRQLA